MSPGTSDSPGIGTVLGSILVAAAAGPATAFLHELDILSLGPGASLWPLFMIVFAAALGIVLGLRIGRPGHRWLRWLAMIPNGLVLCLYGFLLLYFGLGGSR